MDIVADIVSVVKRKYNIWKNQQKDTLYIVFLAVLMSLLTYTAVGFATEDCRRNTVQILFVLKKKNPSR